MHTKRFAQCCAVLLSAQALALSFTAAPEVHVTTHQVTLVWRTDASSNTEVHFGSFSSPTAAGYTDHSVSNARLVKGTQHSRTLVHLAPGMYFFRVRSVVGTDAVESEEGTFAVPISDLRTPIGTLTVNGAVSAVVQQGSVLYFGGRFSEVGTRSGCALATDVDTGESFTTQPQVAGEVYAVVADGNGGYFIGGEFSAVGGLPRSNAAHILGDLGVDSTWAPVVNNRVRAIATLGSSVYLGGDFTRVDGNNRLFAAAIDATTGLVLPWNPSPNQPLRALAAQGASVYLGGEFTEVNGTARNRAAAVDATTAALFPWNPDCNAAVSSIAVRNSTAYLGGMFTIANGSVPRNRLASFDLDAGTATSWDPNVNNAVNALAVAGATVIAGGQFSLVNGTQGRTNLAVFDSVSGIVTATVLHVPGIVYSVAEVGQRLYVGGSFSAVGGRQQANTAAIDLNTGVVASWAVRPNGIVRAVAATTDAVYVGGSFSSVNAVGRSNAAAVNLVTNELLAWNPSVNNSVQSLATAGSSVFLAGSFDTDHIIAVDATTGDLTGWRAQANLAVSTIVVIGSQLYLGGEFATVNGIPRNHAAALDVTTGALSSWAPDFDGNVLSFAASDSTLYVGGAFTALSGGVSRKHAAAFDLTTGELTAWNPSLNGTVHAMAVADSGVYIGGAFTTINGNTTRRYAAQVDLTAGDSSPWNPDPNNSVYELLVADDAVFLGGAFSSLNEGTAQRKRIASVNALTGVSTPWNEAALGGSFGVNVFALYKDCAASTITLGGIFSSVGETPQTNIATLRFPGICRSTPTDAGLLNDGGTEDARFARLGKHYAVACGCSQNLESSLWAVLLALWLHMMRRRKAVVILFILSCQRPISAHDASVAPDDSGVAVAVDAGLPASWPEPLVPGECRLVREDVPNNNWENASVYDSRAHRLVHSGGHVLGGYPQSSYTFRFGAPQFITEAAKPARVPQRRCLVDGTYVASIGQSIFAHGTLEHGSINPGNFKDGYTRLGLADTPGPWLYDAVIDDWRDARPVGQQFDVRYHSPMAWDPATNTVVSLGQNYVQLYHVHSNTVHRRPLPHALENRVFYGIAADPYAKRIVVIGGSQGVFHAQPGDAGANYEERVKGDTWLYDVVEDEWEEVSSLIRPPKGVPGRDFVKFSAIWESRTGNTIYRVVPLSTYEPNPQLWPAAETWAFNVAERNWTQLKLNSQPKFQGQLSFDNDRDRLIILGGGIDANNRPALSRHLFDCSLPTAGQVLPRAQPDLLRAETQTDGSVTLRWVTTAFGVASISRAAASPWPLAFKEIGRVSAASQLYVDLTAQPHVAYAYEVRIDSIPPAPPVLTAPLRPSELTASVESANSVKLNWAPHGAADVVGYRVWRARGGGSGVLLTASPVSQTEFTDNTVDLHDGVVRRYWITAVNRAGVESGTSPQAYSFPEAPLSPTVRQTGPKTYVLSWSWPGDQRILGFDIFHINAHRNTLTEADAFGPTGWYGQVAALTPVRSLNTNFTLTIADTDNAPHHYFWLRAVNVLNQGGLITDIMSATDTRFSPHAAAP